MEQHRLAAPLSIYQVTLPCSTTGAMDTVLRKYLSDSEARVGVAPGSIYTEDSPDLLSVQGARDQLACDSPYPGSITLQTSS